MYLQNRDLRMSQELAKHTMDAASVGIVVATVANWLPAVAALFTIIWTGLRIYEMKTVQRWLRK